LAALFFGSFLLGIKRKGLAEGTKQKERNDTLFNPIAPKALYSKQTASFLAETNTLVPSFHLPKKINIIACNISLHLATILIN
jgi:hypothetical protein